MKARINNIELSLPFNKNSPSDIFIILDEKYKSLVGVNVTIVSIISFVLNGKHIIYHDIIVTQTSNDSHFIKSLISIHDMMPLKGNTSYMSLYDNDILLPQKFNRSNITRIPVQQ